MAADHPGKPAGSGYLPHVMWGEAPRRCAVDMDVGAIGQDQFSLLGLPSPAAGPEQKEAPGEQEAGSGFGLGAYSPPQMAASAAAQAAGDPGLTKSIEQ